MEARLRRAAVAWTVLLALVALFLAGAVDAGRLRFSDHLLLMVAQAPASTPLDLAMSALSELGSVEVTSVLILALAITARSSQPLGWQRWVPVVVFALVTLLEVGAKEVIHQPAPPGYLLRGLRMPGLGADTAFSFPSGHMARGTVVIGLAALRLARRFRQVRWLWLCIVVVWLLGFSRVYVGEHWPSDVAGGILLGGVGLALCLAIAPLATVGDVEGPRSAE